MRQGISRRSAKETIWDFAQELMIRNNDPNANFKLLAIETIALRMGWNELYNNLRYRDKRGNMTGAYADIHGKE